MKTPNRLDCLINCIYVRTYISFVSLVVFTLFCALEDVVVIMSPSGKSKGGDICILRFDGDSSQYRIFASQTKAVPGPFNRGTYVWVKFRNWPRIEEKLIYGPYIHHVAEAHDKIAAVILEASK